MLQHTIVSFCSAASDNLANHWTSISFLLGWKVVSSLFSEGTKHCLISIYLSSKIVNLVAYIYKLYNYMQCMCVNTTRADQSLMLCLVIFSH